MAKKSTNKVKKKTTSKKLDSSKKKTTKSVPSKKVKKKKVAPTSTKKKSSYRKTSPKKPTVKAAVPELIESVSSTENSLARLDPMAQYLTEVRKYPLLTKEQEQELTKHYFETKDPKAAEKLVTSNLRFVVKIAAEYSKFGAKMIDLVQEGNVGLMHAVREFNPYKGVRLITYAVWWIRGYIQEYLMRQYSMVRIGTTQNQRKLFYQLQKQKQELEALGFEAGVKQLSGKLGISEEEITEMHNRMYGRDVSLDQPISDRDSGTLIDLQQDQYSVSADDELEHQELVEKLSEQIEKVRPDLNERELYLLDNRLLSDQPKTLQEIGEMYGITREAVRQMEARLIKKIKTDFL